MIVLYVDDLGIAYSNKKDLDKLFQDLIELAYSNKKDLDKLFQDLIELGLKFTHEGTSLIFLASSLSRMKSQTQLP
jgi:hypothetical protein